MESDPKLNVFTNYNKQFTAVFMIYADCPSEMPEVFQHFEKLSSHLSTPVPPTDGTVMTVVETLSTMGHVAQPLKLVRISSPPQADEQVAHNRTQP
jgi:hypothetical protein